MNYSTDAEALEAFRAAGFSEEVARILIAIRGEIIGAHADQIAALEQDNARLRAALKEKRR